MCWFCWMLILAGIFLGMTSRRSLTWRNILIKGFMCRVSVFKICDFFFTTICSDISLHAVQSTQECEDLMEKGWGNRWPANPTFRIQLYVKAEFGHTQYFNLFTSFDSCSYKSQYFEIVLAINDIAAIIDDCFAFLVLSFFAWFWILAQKSDFARQGGSKFQCGSR